MIPAEAGSVQDNTQLLTSLITTFHKTSVKYASLKALDEGIEEWLVGSSKSGTWTNEQLLSLVRYRAYIASLGSQFPFAKVLHYHRLFTKAINDGEHDMFQPGGHHVTHLYIQAGLLEPQRSSSFHSSRGRGGKSSESGTGATNAAANTGSRPRHPDSGKYPAGSCTKHPTSTTHTTAECRSA